MKFLKLSAVLSTAILFAVLGSANTFIDRKPVLKKSLSKIERPKKAWALRSVLDSRPRILSIALNDKLWIAYNTKTAALYKA